MKREYKLGESHFFPFERWDEFGYSFYPVEANRELKIFGLIAEACKGVDTTKTVEMLTQVSEGLQDCDIENVDEIVIENFRILVRDGEYFQLATYSPVDRSFHFILNRKCLQHIKNFENIHNVKRHLKHCFTCKDVERRIEIDTLARRYGKQLRELYPTESTKDLFKRVHTGDVKDDTLKSNLETAFAYMSLHNQEFFLRNIYDYLEIEETTLEDLLFKGE